MVTVFYDHVHFDGGRLDTLKHPLDRVIQARDSGDPVILNYRQTHRRQPECAIAGKCQVWTYTGVGASDSGYVDGAEFILGKPIDPEPEPVPSNPRIVLTRASDISPLRYRGEWGPWRLDRHDREIYSDPDSYVGYAYRIPLDRCTTSAGVLDMICQVAQKSWGTPEQRKGTVAGLVNAFVDVLHPQANLCSFGGDKRLDLADVRALIANAVERPPR